ncbi:hypothetical protein Q7P37_004505 [Cladosporium fusiforme]
MLKSKLAILTIAALRRFLSTTTTHIPSTTAAAASAAAATAPLNNNSSSSSSGNVPQTEMGEVPGGVPPGSVLPSPGSVACQWSYDHGATVRDGESNPGLCPDHSRALEHLLQSGQLAVDDETPLGPRDLVKRASKHIPKAPRSRVVGGDKNAFYNPGLGQDGRYSLTAGVFLNFHLDAASLNWTSLFKPGGIGRKHSHIRVKPALAVLVELAHPSKSSPGQAVPAWAAGAKFVSSSALDLFLAADGGAWANDADAPKKVHVCLIRRLPAGPAVCPPALTGQILTHAPPAHLAAFARTFPAVFFAAARAIFLNYLQPTP